MGDTTETKALDEPARAAAELDADPFGAGPRARRLTKRSSVLWGFVGLVAIGATLQAAVVLLRHADPPPRSFIAQLAPNLTLELKMPRTGRYQILSVAELRWCMREDIRLEVLETRHAGSATARFQEAVGNYNLRCTRFKYRGNDLAVARRDIDAARSWIVAETLAEALKSGASDDELAMAYWCGNGCEGSYDRERQSAAYEIRASKVYRFGHIQRGLSMALKACGLDPQCAFSRGFAALVWRVMQWGQRRLAAVTV